MKDYIYALQHAAWPGARDALRPLTWVPDRELQGICPVETLFKPEGTSKTCQNIGQGCATFL